MKRNQKLFWKYWFPLLLWMAVIFLLSAQDKDETSLKTGFIKEILAYLGIDASGWMQGTKGFFLRKMAHVSEYAVLYFLAFRVARNYIAVPRLWWITLAGCIAYACTDEFHQTFVVGRVGTPVDVAIDTLGCLLAMGLCWGLYKKEILMNLRPE